MWATWRPRCRVRGRGNRVELSAVCAAAWQALRGDQWQQRWRPRAVLAWLVLACRLTALLPGAGVRRHSGCVCTISHLQQHSRFPAYLSPSSPAPPALADAEVRRHFGAFGPIAEVKLYRKVRSSTSCPGRQHGRALGRTAMHTPQAAQAARSRQGSLDRTAPQGVAGGRCGSAACGFPPHARPLAAACRPPLACLLHLPLCCYIAL